MLCFLRILISHLRMPLWSCCREFSAPSLPWKSLHCYVKFEWGISAHFKVSCFKDSTFIIDFSTVPDYLCVADCTWGFADDRTINKSRDSPQVLMMRIWVHSHSGFSSMECLKLCGPRMESMQLSTLGLPLEAEHMWSPWGHSLRACVMLYFTSSLASFILVIAVWGRLETIVQLGVRYWLKPLSCDACLCFGHANNDFTLTGGIRYLRWQLWY